MFKWWIPVVLLVTGLQSSGGLQVQVLTKSATEGDVQAQIQLAEMYSQGMDVDLDWKQAVQWYEKAAEQNLPKAQYALALCYAEGKGIPKDFDQAILWLNKAAGFYYPPAQYELGRAFETGSLGLSTQAEKAVKWMREAIAREYAPAMGALGSYYLKGFGVKQDLDKAAQWYQRGARLGDPQSIAAIAQHFSELARYIDDEKIITDCVLPRAASGDVETQLALAKYYRALGDDKEHQVQAVKWLSKAADQGDVEASILLVGHYEQGMGTQKDQGKAMHYCRIVADQDNAEYQEKLAEMYAEPGELQNLEASYTWYLKSAMRGRPSAQIKCIFINGQGTGIAKNKVEAYAWAMLVGHNGNKVYQKKLEPILTMDEKMQGMRKFRALLMEIRRINSQH